MTDQAVQKIGESLIAVNGFNTLFNLYLPGILTKLSVSDFRKMLTVISHELCADDCLRFYRLLIYEIDSTKGLSQVQFIKLKTIVFKKMEKLPAWVFEEEA